MTMMEQGIFRWDTTIKKIQEPRLQKIILKLNWDRLSADGGMRVLGSPNRRNSLSCSNKQQ